MSPRDADSGARSILDKRSGQAQFYVLVDNPNDCRATISAFRKLGCKVRVESDGSRLRITHRE
jgi:hypothetical protein